MTIYIIYIAVVILVGWYLYGDRITPKQKSNCLMAAAVFLIILMSMRYSIGYDYISYEQIFRDIGAQSLSDIVAQRGVESVFFFFMKAVSTVGLGYQQFLFFCNIIMVACVFVTIHDHSPIWWLSATLYMTLLFVPYSMNLLRQAMAASIIFAGWGLLKKGKWWQWCLLVLLATTIHLSAIIMIPAFFLLRLPYNLPVLATFGGLTLLGFLATPFFLSWGVRIFPKYAIYVDAPIYGVPASFGSVFPILLYAAAVMLFAKKMIARDKANSILVYSAFFTFAFTLMIMRMYVLERFAIYFFFFAMLLLPELVAALGAEEEAQLSEKTKAKIRKGKELSTAAVVTILILGFSLWYFTSNAMVGSHKFNPYVGIWETQNAVDNNTYYSLHS